VRKEPREETSNPWGPNLTARTFRIRRNRHPRPLGPLTRLPRRAPSRTPERLRGRSSGCVWWRDPEAPRRNWCGRWYPSLDRRAPLKRTWFDLWWPPIRARRERPRRLRWTGTTGVPRLVPGRGQERRLDRQRGRRRGRRLMKTRARNAQKHLPGDVLLSHHHHLLHLHERHPHQQQQPAALEAADSRRQGLRLTLHRGNGLSLFRRLHVRRTLRNGSRVLRIRRPEKKHEIMEMSRWRSTRSRAMPCGRSWV
jgi:hypothetical protein